jgi:rhomboid protease GluP
VSDDGALVEVFRTLTPRSCDDRALVLEAVGVPAVMVRDGPAYALLVAADQAAAATVELERYARENMPVFAAPAPKLHRGALVSAAGYAVVLFLVGVATSRSLLGRDWYSAGVLDGERLRSGELWRAVTALTLHADLAHLAANAGFGALFGALAARVYGAGCGWLLILVAAAFANVANALWMATGRASLGASTAVFAALGALGAYRWPAATRRGRLAWPGASLIAALVLLSLLGTGDEHTDIAAHALGFGFGALLALPMRRWPVGRSRRLQWLAALAALLIVTLAWLAALAGRPPHLG